MIRVWRVEPDHMTEVPMRHPESGEAMFDGEGAALMEHVPTVSKGALEEAMLEAAAVLRVAGGQVLVAVGRAKTDVEHERVVNGVALRWQDRSDAKPATEPLTVLAAGADYDGAGAQQLLEQVLQRAHELNPALAQHLATGDPLPFDELEPADDPEAPVELEGDAARGTVPTVGDPAADVPGTTEAEDTSSIPAGAL